MAGACTLAEGQASPMHSCRWRPLPRRVADDKIYGCPHVRQSLRQRSIRVTAPGRKDRPRQDLSHQEALTQRDMLQRLSRSLKHVRRLATHYENLSESYRALWVPAVILLLCRANTSYPSAVVHLASSGTLQLPDADGTFPSHNGATGGDGFVRSYPNAAAGSRVGSGALAGPGSSGRLCVKSDAHLRGA